MASPEALGAAISNPAMSNHSLGSRCQRRPRSTIDFVRCPVTQRLVRSLVVVKLEIVEKMNPRRRARLVVVKINLLVLDRAPKPFDENVVVDPASSIHAHLNPFVFQKAREIHARELRPLVRVENLRLRDPECFPQRLQTEARVRCRGKLPIIYGIRFDRVALWLVARLRKDPSIILPAPATGPPLWLNVEGEGRSYDANERRSAGIEYATIPHHRITEYQRGYQ